MFDWFQNLRKTKEETQKERLNAYIDGELSAAEQRAFEQEMSHDDALRGEIESLQNVKNLLKQAPRLRAPRNFTLDPAIYGVQQRPSLASQLYPQLRVATAVMAVLLVGVISVEFLTGSASREMSAPAAEEMVAFQVEFDASADEAAEEAEPLAATSEMADEAAANDMAEEEMMEEEVAIIAEMQEEVVIEEAEMAESAAEGAVDATAEEAPAEPAEDAADDAGVAPRPEATSLPDTRVESAPTQPPPTATAQPTVAATATITPTQPAASPTTADAPSQTNYLRLAQIIIAFITASLLAITLYIHRQL